MRHGHKWNGNFPGMFPENPEIIESFNRKSWKFTKEISRKEISRKEISRKEISENFGKPREAEYVTEISGNSYRNFSSNGKRPRRTKI